EVFCEVGGKRCLFAGLDGNYNSPYVFPLHERKRQMPGFLAYTWLPPLLNFLLFFVNLFLILLILIQRGKGGGLAGALGGMGGSSPFGSRAGDTFTRITIYAALI